MMEIKNFKKYDVYVYIGLAYCFSLLMRLIWVYQFHDYAPFYWNSQLMINTNDGYFFASGAKNLIDHSLVNNLRVPGTEFGLVSFTYFLAKILPFSLDTIILYLPTIISSLIVIPIILIMKLYNKTYLGFLAALLSSITWSYYNRTMTGYYDTDLFALTFPVFIIYFLIKGIKQESLFSIFIASLFISTYFYAYDASPSVIYAIAITFILYMVTIKRKMDKKSLYPFIILVAIGSLNIEWYLRFSALFVLYFVFIKGLIKEEKYLLYLTIFAILLFAYFNNVFSLIYYKVFTYTVTGEDTGNRLHFYKVFQTIREAGKIPFDTFANRISGAIFSFVIACIGYVFLAYKKKEFLLFIPLIGIGFFAYIGGLRFTVYAIPAMSLGLVYLIYFIMNQFSLQNKVKNGLLFMITLLFLYPNIMHIISYKVPTVFNAEEVKVLNKLKNISTSKDYTITWWDYGYPIWYYSDTNTLIDGGKHRHDNFIVSQILTTDSQMQAANLARLSVEKYVKKQLKEDPIADYIFENNASTPLDVNSLLDEMELSDYKLPKKTRDIYLYLPNRMLNIFPTVTVFSNLNLNTGKKGAAPFFFVSRNFKQVGNKLLLGNGVSFLNNTGELELGRQKVKIKHFSVVEYDKRGKLHKQDQILDYSSRLNMIYMKNYNTILVLDDKMYNSVFIQLFVFENYDRELFEPVILNPLVKIYKLKR